MPRNDTAVLPPHYGRVAIALHWLIGLCLIAQICFGIVMDDLAPRGTPARTDIVNLHKSFGIVLLVLILVRLMWRLAHRPPPWPPSMPEWQARAATFGHGMLYACMLVMPLSGYIGSNFSKYGVKFFGHPLAPWGGDKPSVYQFFNSLHAITAFLFAALIIGHVGMALRHLFIDRDGVFQRMWPSRPLR